MAFDLAVMDLAIVAKSEESRHVPDLAIARFEVIAIKSALIQRATAPGTAVVVIAAAGDRNHPVFQATP